MDNSIIQELQKISLSMFRKGFFGIFHGSISAKIGDNRFVINKSNAIFDEIDDNSLTELYFNKDYRWSEASVDAEIHKNIYVNFHDAKYIVYGMPPHTVAYSLEHSKIIPKDYFGYKYLESVKIFDPKNFDDWYERAHIDIVRYFKEQNSRFVVIRGYGIYMFDRDINQIVKKMAIIENSCRILQFSKS